MARSVLKKLRGHALFELELLQFSTDTLLAVRSGHCRMMPGAACASACACACTCADASAGCLRVCLCVVGGRGGGAICATNGYPRAAARGHRFLPSVSAPTPPPPSSFCNSNRAGALTGSHALPGGGHCVHARGACVVRAYGVLGTQAVDCVAFSPTALQEFVAKLKVG